MWTLTARDDASLRDVSGALHDAYIDGDVEFDREAGVAVVPILQEGWPEGPPAEKELVRETWRYHEYRVTFFRGRLTIRRVNELQEPEDWDAPMIQGVAFDAEHQEVRVYSDEALRAQVQALDVELGISSEPGGHVRRRIGKLTKIESDVWLDQRRQASGGSRMPL